MAADIRFGAGGHKMLDRIIGVQFGAAKGLLVFPHSPANPAGWGRPFTDLAGNPLVPGTPGGDGNRNVFRRGLITDLPPSTLVKAQDFRLFEKDQICDWRGLETEVGRGDQPILHFHGPPARYFPVLTIDEGDTTAELYEPFFYDRAGTLKVEGPTAVATSSNGIKGVAKRNIGEPNEEYICIIGTPYDGGFEVHAKGVAPTEDWRHLGTVGPFSQLGSSGFVNATLQSRWDVPVHFNRLGTKAVTICFGLNDAPVDEDVRRAFSLEISISGEAVTDSGLLDVTQGSTNPVVRRNLSEVIIDSPEADSLPDCPTNGSFVVETTTVKDEELSNVKTTGPTTLAIDYKIDTDNELGTIKITEVLTTTRVTSGGGTVTVTSLACNSSGTIIGVPGSGNGGGTVIITTNRADDSAVEWAIDGGRHSGTMSVFLAALDRTDATTVNTTVSTTTNDVTTGVVSQARTLDLGEPDWINNRTFIGVKMDVVFADIRYGSLMLQNRYMQPEQFNFAPNPFEYPGTGGTLPAQDTGPMKNPRLGGSPGDVQTGGLVFGFSTPPPFISWANNLSFTSKVLIESEDFSKVIEDHDTAFSFGHATGSGGVKNNILQQQAGDLFFVNPVNVPFGTNETVDQGDSDERPLMIAASSQYPATRDKQMWAAHDRHGSFFYSVFRQGNDFSNAFPSNGIPLYSPGFTFVSHVDYGFEDPVDRVGMPPDSVNAIITEGATFDADAPEFQPVVCV